MKSKINHYCCVCGIGYNSCDHCNGVKSYTPWRILTDSIDHYKIYIIVCDYRDKKITKDKAKEMLSHVDITGWETFKEGTKNLIAEIFQEKCY
jgi:hypothetical protein